MADSYRKLTLGPWSKKSFHGENVRIDGLEDLLKELKDLHLNVNSNLRAALRQGIKVIQAEAEQNAKEFTNHKATRIDATSRKTVGKVSVTLSISKRRFYLGFFESGVTPHEIKGLKGKPLVFEGDEGLIITQIVAHPGMPARPWLRPAVDAKRSEAIEKVSEVLRDVIEKKRAQLAEDAESEE